MMSMSKKYISAEDLKRLVSYDPLSGKFTWLVRAAHRIHVGDDAGSINSKGYSGVYIKGIFYLSHKLAWIYMTGSDAESAIDHINRVKNDNRWENLRLASHSQNAMNRVATKHSKTGLKNICITKYGTFAVEVRAKGISKRKNFKTIEDAVVFAELMRSEIHGEFINNSLC